MERLYWLLCKIGEGIVIAASANSAMLCLILADQRQDVSWYFFAMAIVSLLILWMWSDREDETKNWPGEDDDQP